MSKEPVRLITWALALVTAVTAAVTAYEQNHSWIAAAGVGLAALQVAGGEVARSQVTPVAKVATYVEEQMPAVQARVNSAIDQAAAQLEASLGALAAKAQQYAALAAPVPAPADAAPPVVDPAVPAPDATVPPTGLSVPPPGSPLASPTAQPLA